MLVGAGAIALSGCASAAALQTARSVPLGVAKVQVGGEAIHGQFVNKPDGGPGCASFGPS